MSKRDPMRPYMNVIDAMLAKMVTSTPHYPYIVNIHWNFSNFIDDSLYSSGKTHHLSHKVVNWVKMIWTMTQMRNRWQR